MGIRRISFDKFANKRYPWNAKDLSLLYAAANECLLRSLRAVAGSKAIDRDGCIYSYMHSGSRVVIGLEGNRTMHWPVREEMRITWSLFEVIVDKWIAQGKPSLRSETEIAARPYFVHPTDLVVQFTKSVVFPIASWYQTTLLSQPIGMLSKDQQKLISIISTLLRICYSSADFSRYPMGLNLKAMMQKRRFAYFPDYIMHWESNNLRTLFIDQFPSLDNIIRSRHSTRAVYHNIMQNALGEVSQIAGRILQLSKEELDSFTYRWLNHVCAMIVIIQFMNDTLNAIFNSTLQFPGKEIWKRKIVEQRIENDDNIIVPGNND